MSNNARSFFSLLAAQFFGALNDNIFRTIFTTSIAFHLIPTHDSHNLIYLALGLFILPFVTFSYIAGQVADIYSKSTLIRRLKFIEIFIYLFAFTAFYFGNVYLILLLIFITGTQSTFLGPVKYSILPDILNKGKLLKGNAAIESSTFLAILLGGILGSYIINQNSILIIAGLMVVNSILGYLAALSIQGTYNQSKTKRIDFRVIQTHIHMFEKILQKKNLVLSILGISWLWFSGSIFLTLMPSVISDIFHLEPKYYTIFLVIFTLGIATGSFSCHFILRGKITNQLLPLCLLLKSLMTLDLVSCITSLNLIRMYTDLFIISVLAGIYSVPLFATLQGSSKKENRSQNIATNNIINSIFIILASLSMTLGNSVGLKAHELLLYFSILNFSYIFICIPFFEDKILKKILRIILKICFRVDVTGINNYRKAGDKVIIVANHTSYLDPIILYAFLPEQYVFAINTNQSKKWWVKPVLSFVKTFAVDPLNPLGLKHLIYTIQSGHKVVIFPEGRISDTGSLMKIYEGPAMIAEKSKANILPIKISGAGFSFFSKLKNILKQKLFPKISVKINPAKKISVQPGLSLREKRYQSGIQLYDIMSEMLFSTFDIKNNVFNAILSSARKYGVHKKIINDITNQNLSYKQLIIAAIIIANKINSNEKTVGLLLPNSIAAASTYFAVQSLGKQAVMLNYSAGTESIISACRTALVKTVITSKQFIEKAELYELNNALIKKKINVLYLEDLKFSISLINKIYGYIKYVGLIYLNIGLPKNIPDKPSTILFTSGSEGAPKAVVLSHKNIQSNIAQAHSRIDFSAGDTVLNALPVFHAYGLTAGTILPIIFGMQLFLYPSPLHYRVIPEISYDIGATILFGTNTILSKYAKLANPYDFYSLRYVIAGAEKLSDQTQTIWNEKFGVRILEGYGVTECSPVISINTPMHFKKGTVGRIFPGIEYKLKKVSGIEEGGELHVSGPNVMLGYIYSDNPGKLVKPKNGFHNTGDIASIDHNKFLTILGRTKRFAKIGGEMIPLSLVEEKIQNISQDFTNAIIAVSDGNKGEKLVLITNNPNLNKSALIQYFKQINLPTIYIPKDIKFEKNIPLLGSGKIDYIKLLKLM